MTDKRHNSTNKYFVITILVILCFLKLYFWKYDRSFKYCYEGGEMHCIKAVHEQTVRVDCDKVNNSTSTLVITLTTYFPTYHVTTTNVITLSPCFSSSLCAMLAFETSRVCPSWIFWVTSSIITLLHTTY